MYELLFTMCIVQCQAKTSLDTLNYWCLGFNKWTLVLRLFPSVSNFLGRGTLGLMKIESTTLYNKCKDRGRSCQLPT
ncbi:hypothetical protein BDY21DRAFT_62969 [Lineolata rhizophorae]|uniref:Uncharacterized protein n=1 Tax=Lineolata rhizophorae TaxID=578093 RepID=A0A6A6NWQ0_9PEZI|nr:hypothetical protein BDY21DRAFT_62969 [Lineolata rhizophorae]